MTYVLDTDVFSAIVRGDARCTERFLEQRPSDVLLPQPVVAEVKYGLSRLPRSKKRETIERRVIQLFQTLERTPWTDEVSDVFGSLKADLERRGQRLEDLDLAIAAHAIALEATLATRNVRHFGRISALRVDDWSAK